MSNKHKNPTISFRITDAERKQIEARILASGLMKKDYFVRSCINNRICVVGKKGSRTGQTQVKQIMIPGSWTEGMRGITLLPSELIQTQVNKIFTGKNRKNHFTHRICLRFCSLCFLKYVVDIVIFVQSVDIKPEK